MNILATQYSLNTKSFEIYLSGCSGNPHCKGCHNPESWDFTKGTKFDNTYENSIQEKIISFKTLIDNVMIFGGEPLDQDITELTILLKFLKSIDNVSVWIFTRYDITEVPPCVKQHCDYIKCGRYIETLTVDDNIQYGIKLATSNQKIYKKGVDY